MPNLAEKRLSRAAQRVARQPAFVAYALEKYRQQEGQSETEIMASLNCFGAAFYQLALCQRPDAKAEDFGRRVRRIAESVGAGAGALAQILRQVAHLDALEAAPVAAPLVANVQLLAARDHDGLCSDSDDAEPNP